MTFQPDLCADMPIVGLVGRRACARSMTSTTCSTTSRWRAPSPPIPPAPALIAFTSGTTRDPKGVVHSHQTLGFETRQLLAELPARPRPPAHRHAGRALHRHARRLPDPGARGRADRSVRRVGSGQGAQAHGDRRPVDRRRAAVLRHQPARPSRLHRRTHGALHDRRPWRFDGARRGHPAARRSWASSCSGRTAAPSTRRSPVRAPIAPEDKRLYTDGNARPGVEIRLGRRRRDLQPGPGSVPRLHRRRADRARPSTTTAGTAPATSACSTTTAT